MLEVYHFADLKGAGFGTRATISKKVRLGTFPAPVNDGSGRPVWLRETIEGYKSSLRKYKPEPIFQIEQARSPA